MNSKLEFFKMYCEHKGLLNRYAFGVVSDNGNSIKFLNGIESNILMWQGKYIENGLLYKIYEATCSGTCKIGEHAQKCIDSGTVSKSKCSVYSYEKIDLENFKYELSFEDLQDIFSF